MPELEGKRIGILLEQQYQELEVWYPLYRLREAGATVQLIGPEAGKTYPSKLGYPATADRAATECSTDEFDALVIPGGFAPDFMRRTSAMTNLVAEMAAADKPVAAICHGVWMLCSTPALRGRRATSFFAIKDDVTNAGAEWVDAEVVKDGNIITSRTPDDLPAFMRALIDSLLAR
ncbi:MAG: type 1 glutamine amidotransferase [Planctomycetes bacterium]|nr:type 1 glutamine amidotransferase [Planctomycetota bacterium]